MPRKEGKGKKRTGMRFQELVTSHPPPWFLPCGRWINDSCLSPSLSLWFTRARKGSTLAEIERERRKNNWQLHGQALRDLFINLWNLIVSACQRISCQYEGLWESSLFPFFIFLDSQAQTFIPNFPYPFLFYPPQRYLCFGLLRAADKEKGLPWKVGSR